jgi:hypothetical protein
LLLQINQAEARFKTKLFMKKNLSSLGTALSRDEAKKVKGGDGEPTGVIGSCTVKCLNNRYSCTSDKGDCAHDDYNYTICCDGTTYNC